MIKKKEREYMLRRKILSQINKIATTGATESQDSKVRRYHLKDKHNLFISQLKKMKV